MQGQDVALLLKLAIQNAPQVPSKDLAESPFISPSEVSKSLKRSAESGLLHIANGEKRVNRSYPSGQDHSFRGVLKMID